MKQTRRSSKGKLSKPQKLFATLVASGKNLTEAAAVAFPDITDPAPKGCREAHIPKVREHIETLKDRYAPDIYEKVIRKGLEVLDTVKTAREFRDVSETLAKITPNMNEPERKESKQLSVKLPDFINQLEPIETALIEGEMPKALTEGVESENKG